MRVEIPIVLNLRIVPDAFFGALISGLEPSVVPALFPQTHARLMELARKGRALWSAKASQIPGTNGRPLRLGTGADDRMVRLDKTAFVNSIQIRQEDGESITVYSSDPQAECIESGTPGGIEIDLHKVLAYAPKARLTKPDKGGVSHRYLRVPFRHQLESLPSGVVRAMKDKSPYLVASTYSEPSIHDGSKSVTRFLYVPGAGRLKASEIQHVNSRVRNSKYLIGPDQAQRLTGLMRTGEKGHGAYLTIRTLSEANPEGWRVPAYDAQHLAEQTATQLRADSVNWFTEALKADALALVERVGR